jgi:hypothetical protein
MNVSSEAQTDLGQLELFEEGYDSTAAEAGDSVLAGSSHQITG